MIDLLAFAVVLLVASAWVSAPLRGRARAATRPAPDAALQEEVTARLAAVRDAELDASTGKLSAAEHQRLDGQLRSEALEAMRRASGDPGSG